MNIKIIEDRIASYKPASKNDEINAFKEIAQEIALYSLSKANLFKQAAFHGGTCLRIVYGLPRFSEDLDFMLFEPNRNFNWRPFLEELQLDFAAFGLNLTTLDRDDVGNDVKRAFIKEDSFGTVLKLSYERNRADIQSIKIKLEIDTNPPIGSNYAAKLIDFPTPFSIVTQDPGSLFAGKLHALLCREYIKGRDWYDFIWYVVRETPVNFTWLTNALQQLGPFKGVNLNIDVAWLIAAMRQKVASIDWKAARSDVEIFVSKQEITSIQLWNKTFFEHYIEKMWMYLNN